MPPISPPAAAAAVDGPSRSDQLIGLLLLDAVLVALYCHDVAEQACLRPSHQAVGLLRRCPIWAVVQGALFCFWFVATANGPLAHNRAGIYARSTLQPEALPRKGLG